MAAVLVALDASAVPSPLPHAWEEVIGSGHALLALRSDYQSQIAQCRQELGVKRVRFHGLLCDDVGTLVSEQNVLRDCFYNADAIWDALLAIGIEPFVELSFMPTALASGSTTVFHYQGNVTPPARLDAWVDLVRRLARHWVERYGRDVVERWRFEVWNEPNLRAFWTGSRDDYFALYRATATALKRTSDALSVGGPATADNGWIGEFVDFCERESVPLDFVSTHHYPTDAFGKPGDDTEAQLAASTRSVLRERARATRRCVGQRPLFYTEWSTSSNPRDPLHDAPYAAPVIVKTMMEARGLVDGYSWWTFSDLFEENYFPAAPFQGGFGLLTIHGVPKPSYRAFELLHRIGTELVFALEDAHPTVDAWAVREPAGSGLTILITNHALPRHPISSEAIHLRVANLPSAAMVTVRRIDADHANATARWEALGRPQYLTAEQVEDLREYSRMAIERPPWTQAHGVLEMDLTLPPHAVAEVTLDSVARVACP